MISATGHNLNIAILTETLRDWEAFATWYSIWKNLPDAKVRLICVRNSEIGFQYFQWARRINLSLAFVNKTCDDPKLESLHLFHIVKSKFLNQNTTILLRDLTMAVDVLDQPTLDLLNRKDFDLIENSRATVSSLLLPSVAVENMTLLGDPQCRVLEDTFCYDVKDSEPRCLVDYSKGCGKWVDSLKGCPFSNAAGMAADAMSVNEIRVIELWRRMVSLYSAIN